MRKILFSTMAVVVLTLAVPSMAQAAEPQPVEKVQLKKEVLKLQAPEWATVGEKVVIKVTYSKSIPADRRS